MWRLIDRKLKVMRINFDVEKQVRLFMDDHVIFFKTEDEAEELIPYLVEIFEAHGMQVSPKKT